jgi:hypothetical protein
MRKLHLANRHSAVPTVNKGERDSEVQFTESKGEEDGEKDVGVDQADQGVRSPSAVSMYETMKQRKHACILCESCRRRAF